MKYIAIILPLLLISCVSLDNDWIYSKVTISPSMSPEGIKTLNVFAGNKLPGYAKDMTLLEFHKNAIAREMGRLNICTNGYDINYDTPEISDIGILYTGTCKRPI